MRKPSLKDVNRKPIALMDGSDGRGRGIEREREIERGGKRDIEGRWIERGRS